jgi:hypothetical protein
VLWQSLLVEGFTAPAILGCSALNSRGFRVCLCACGPLSLASGCFHSCQRDTTAENRLRFNADWLHF